MDAPKFVVCGNQAFNLDHVLMVEWDRHAKTDDEKAISITCLEDLSYSYPYEEGKALLRAVGLLD